MSKNIRSLEENLNLQSHPAGCAERSYTSPLEVSGDIAGGDVICTLLEAAGWVPLESENGMRRFAPPLAGYVAGALRSCVVDRDGAGRMLSSAGLRSAKEPLRILDAPGGRVPTGVTVPSPKNLTVALARKILAGRGVDLDGAKEEISNWTSSLQEMIPEDKGAINSVGAGSGRAYTHRGELLVSIDRQTGSLSFLPTGDAVGPEGPYSQKTKVYETDTRKAPLAVVFHRGSAVRANAARANPKALEKSLYATMRSAIAGELINMTDEEFEAAFGDESMKKLASKAEETLAEAMNALGAAARRAREEKREGGRGDQAAAAWVVSEMDAFGRMLDRPHPGRAGGGGDREITNPLDLLLPAAGEHPWLFPAYSGKEVHRKGVIHLHGVTGKMLTGLFKAMQESDDFVLHRDGDEEYEDTYRAPFEGSIESLARELDGDGARDSRKALQRARVMIQDARESGSVGFLELVKGRGLVLGDGKPLEPVQAMSALLGPARDSLGGDDVTLGEISSKIDALTERLLDGGDGAGIGSIRDFASRVLRKTEISRELFGEQGVAALRVARAAVVRAEKEADGGRGSKGGAEKAALQAAVCDCLCHYLFGTASPTPRSKRALVDRLVAGAANSEFVYFAAQAGVEGILKIGKAVDVDSRMSDLSKEGHDVFPLAYIAVPGIPVGDWALSSVAAAAGVVGGADACKKATRTVNRLTGLYGSPESGGAAEFFIKAVNFALAKEVGSGGVRGKSAAELREEEVEALLGGSKLMRARTARSVHAIIQAVHETVEGAGGAVEKQKKIREAVACTLSLLAAESAWERIPAGGEEKIKSGFYEIDETTQMPKHCDAWAYRVQTGALVAERALHRKYQAAKVHGEWFYLLAATKAVIRDAEREFSTRAEVCCGGSIDRLVSDLQRSGQQVCTRTELLPHSRGEWYQSEVERIQAEEYGLRLQKGIAAGNRGAGLTRAGSRRGAPERQNGRGILGE